MTQPAQNDVLIEMSGRYDIAERLQQIFLDADELLSDVTNEIRDCVIDTETASGELKVQLLEATAVLRALRRKLDNVTNEFKPYYVLAKPNPGEAGIAALRNTASHYKE